MKICSVIVTYGDRFHLLKQVINACFKEGVDKVIVVDNASTKSSKKQLQEFEKQNKNKLKVIYLDKNTGSAGGYKRGLEEAYKCKECEFIWLLDDDNEPQKNSLKILKEFWNKLDEEDKEEKIALLSYRPDRIQYKEAIMTNNPNLVLGRKNSFLGFHIFDLPKKVVRLMKRKFGIKTFKEYENIKTGKVAVAPYGGMFFNKKIIDKVGYPREEFFVYADDHEWSYRITKNGGEIFLVLDSELKDIDKSWNIASSVIESFDKGSNFRIYYSTRNRIFFEKQNLITNKIIYFINMWLYKKRLQLLMKNKDNFKVFKKAMNDGLKNKLGRTL